MMPGTEDNASVITYGRKGNNMKNVARKLLAIGLTGALAVVSFTACSKAKETTAGTTAETAVEMVKGDNKVGGWSYAEDPAVDEHVKAVVDKATEKLLGAEYEPVAYLGSQVVAGINHAVLCRITPVTPDAEGTYAIVYIYEDLSGNCEITKTTDIVLSSNG